MHIFKPLYDIAIFSKFRKNIKNLFKNITNIDE